MINLIPNEDKKQMSRDFYLRLVTLFFVMLSMSLLTASVLILPSYFLSYVEKNTINANLELQKNKLVPLPDQDTLMTVKDLKNELDLVENAKKNQGVFSQKVMNEIISKKTPGIKITGIFYQNDSKTGGRVNISGRASNREILLSFRLALENDAAFSKVDLPISNFVKGSDIEFNLSLTPS